MTISDDQLIAYLNQHEDEEGFRFDLLYVFEIENPVQRNGGNVVLTPSSTVPPDAELDPSVRDELDAGTAAFVFYVLSVPTDTPDDESHDMLWVEYERHEEAFETYYDAYWRSPSPEPDPQVAVTAPPTDGRQCLACHTPISDRAANARYCGDACRQSSYRQRRQLAS